MQAPNSSNEFHASAHSENNRPFLIAIWGKGYSYHLHLTEQELGVLEIVIQEAKKELYEQKVAKQLEELK
jgi:hypothetical protein